MPPNPTRADLRSGALGAPGKRALARADAEDAVRAAGPSPPAKRGWSNAQMAPDADGVRMSKMERRVFHLLVHSLVPGEILARQVRIPLDGMYGAGGRQLSICIDFAILSPKPSPDLERVQSAALPVRPWEDSFEGPLMPWWVLWVEAKGVRRQRHNGTWTKPRISRDWARGKAAFERAHARLWHWDGIGEPPWKVPVYE